MQISEKTLKIVQDLIMSDLRDLKSEGFDEQEVKETIDAANELGCNIDWTTLDPNGF